MLGKLTGWWSGGGSDPSSSGGTAAHQAAAPAASSEDEIVLFAARGTLLFRPSSQGPFQIAAGLSKDDQILKLIDIPQQGGGKGGAPSLYVLSVENYSTGNAIIDDRVGAELEMNFTLEAGSCLFTINVNGKPSRCAFQFCTNHIPNKGDIPPREILGNCIYVYNILVYAALSGSKRADIPGLSTTPSPSAKQKPVLPSVNDETPMEPEVDLEEDWIRAEFPMRLDDDEDEVDSDPESRMGMANRGTVSSFTRPVDDARAPTHHDAVDAGVSGTIKTQDELFSFSDDVTTSVTGSGGTNLQLMDSAAQTRGIVLQAGKDKTVVVQAHAYNERGMQGDHQEFRLTQPLVPTSAILAEGDRKMMVVNGTTSTTVAQVDCEVGKVVENYELGNEFKVKAITHADKFGERDPTVYTCMNTAAAFNIDTRLDPKKCGVVESGKDLTDYVHKRQLDRPSEQFTCHATSASGHLAIGDKKGNIRFFSGPPGARKETGKGYYPKTAKTMLKGSQDEPILHLDITSDGMYILATCRTHLLLVCTRFRDDGGKALNGFESRMGQKRPRPLRLSMNPDQTLALGGREKIPDFTKATFEANAHGEHWIAASAGPHLITWNFDAVKKALAAHKAVPADSRDMGTTIRQSQMGGESERVFFMTDAEVGLQTRSSARKAGKFTFRF